MNLKEQLQELRGRLLRDTSNLIPGYKQDFLYSTTDLLRYIKEAEFKFAKETHVLRESLNPVMTQVVLVAGVKDYELNCAVFEVMSARYDTDRYDLQRSGHHELLDYDDENTFDILRLSSTTTETGRPRAYYLDEGSVGKDGDASVVFSVYPVPTSAEAGKRIYLRVNRTPIRSYSEEKMDFSHCEFPLEFQLDVLSWAAYRALQGLDADKGAAIPADRHRADFENAVLEAKRRLRRQTSTAMRIGYGGAGFSWSR